MKRLVQTELNQGFNNSAALMISDDVNLVVLVCRYKLKNLKKLTPEEGKAFFKNFFYQYCPKKGSTATRMHGISGGGGIRNTNISNE